MIEAAQGIGIATSSGGLDMDVSEALRIIRSLADGVDPETGEVLAEQSPYNQPQVVRALFMAVEALEQRNRPVGHGNSLRPRAGDPWDADEDRTLCDEFESRMTVSELAKKHGRTKGAIRNRLTKLGKDIADLSQSDPVAP